MSKESLRRCRKLYCKSCWRDEYFKPVKYGWLTSAVLAIATLGLIFVFRPSRCVTCGQKRIAYPVPQAPQVGRRELETAEDSTC
jgi:hypothetical protein